MYGRAERHRAAFVTGWSQSGRGGRRYDDHKQAMRTLTAVPVPALKHPSQRRQPLVEAGPVAVTVMAGDACPSKARREV